MMKRVVAGSIAAASALFVTGCQMCTAPLPDDPSCVEKTHAAGIAINPDVVEYSKPLFMPTKDAFRPVYKAGTERVSAIGSGNSLEDATADAVSQILLNSKCDYIVSVTRVITKKTHPSGFLRFATTNYTVTVSGLPIYLEKLEKVEKEVPPPEDYLTKKDAQKMTDDIIKTVKDCQCKCESGCGVLPGAGPFAQVTLTDINLSMTAKAVSDKPVAIAVPPPAPKPLPPVKK